MTGLGGHVPQVEPTEVAARRQQRAVPVEGHGEHRSGARHDRPTHATPGVTSQSCTSPCRCWSLNPSTPFGSTATASSRPSGLKATCQTGSVPLVERATDGRPAPRIEEPNLPVDRSDGDELPVGVEGDCGDGRVAVDPASLPSRRRVVHDRAAVEPPRDEPPAVGAEGHVGGQIGRRRPAALRSPALRSCSRRPPNAGARSRGSGRRG